MNSIMTGYYLPTFQAYQAMRDQLIEALTDDDLGYTPGGANPTLGALCRQIAGVRTIYAFGALSAAHNRVGTIAVGIIADLCPILGVGKFRNAI
jgi:hypothetical protein